MGGIVNVVISVAALTGVPLYLPLIWSLFSKNLNGRAILSTTVTSLTVNAVLKFITPAVVGFSLSRAEEMLVGVLFPALLLAGYEIYRKLSGSRVCVPMPAAENAAAPPPRTPARITTTASASSAPERRFRAVSSP